MSETKNRYIPLDEAWSPRVRLNIKLPNYVGQSNIGVNVSALEKLCRMGGIEHLRVSTVNDQDTSQFVPTVAGFDSQGNAYAAKTGVKVEVPTSTYDTEDDELTETRPHAVRTINVGLNLNTNEIAERIRRDERWSTGVRSADGWSHYLNKDIKKAVSATGAKHLTLGVSRYNLYWALFANISAVLVSAGAEPLVNTVFRNWNPHVPAIEEVIFNVIFRNIICNACDYLGYRNNPKYDFRLSLFYGPQFDRALLLKVMTTKSTLVKPLGSESL